MAGTRPRWGIVGVRNGLDGRESTYWIHFKIPWLTRLVKVDDDFFVLQTKLLDHNVCAMSPGAAVVGVECDLVAGTAHRGFGDVGYESRKSEVGVGND